MNFNIFRFQLGPNYDTLLFDPVLIGGLLVLLFLIIIITVIVLLAFRARKYKKEFQNLTSDVNGYQQQLQTFELEKVKLLQEPAVIHEHYKTRIIDLEEKLTMMQFDHSQTIEQIHADKSLELLTQSTEFENKIESLKEKHEKDRKSSYRLGGNQVIGDISQIAGIFHTISEYDHFSLITSVSKQASYDAIGMSDDKLDFIEFKTKGARLSGKEGLVKKLINDGKVGHRIIDVILPPDLQFKDRK